MAMIGPKTPAMFEDVLRMDHQVANWDLGTQDWRSFAQHGQAGPWTRPIMNENEYKE